MNKQMVVLALAVMLVSSWAFAEDYWGSIAVDQSNGIPGTAYNFKTEKEAVDASIKTCRKKGGSSKCKAIWSWANACAAVAWSPENKAARGAMANTSLKLAESKARARCKEVEKDPSCEVVASACTSWETITKTETIIWGL